MKLRIIEQVIDSESRNTVAGLFLKLKEMRAALKGKKKDAVKKAQADIKAIRDEIRTFAFMGFGADLVFGRNIISLNNGELGEFPTRAELKALRASYRKEIQQKRKELRQVNEESKSYRGYNYTLVNGVFAKKESILEVQEDTAQISRVRQSKIPYTKKDNYVGIEMECVIKCSREVLEEKFAGKKLGGFVNLKGDSSISATDTHPNPIEVTVLCKESELESVMAAVCKVLSLPSVDARANNSCGLHVHLDMRNRKVDEAYKKLFHSQSIMLNMLPSNRRSDTSPWAQQYCQRNKAGTFSEHDKTSNRYFNINTKSFNKFKTLEIRSHSGTVNATKIINWVKLLTMIVSAEVLPDTTFRSINTFSEFFSIPDTLKQYIEKRTKKFEDSKVDTVVDDRDVA